MAWLDYDQTTPEVTVGDDGLTARLVVHGPKTSEWRESYNTRAAAEPLPITALEVGGRTVLDVAVAYNEDKYPINVRELLNHAVRLLNGHAIVPETRNVVEKPMPGWDGVWLVQTAVGSWWADYRGFGEVNRPQD